RCVARRTPNIIIEDLRDLLQTGFASLDHSLSIVPEHRMVPRLVDVWLLVFGTILPYVQAVFLPLDLEFKGRGSIMSPREAADFWGADPDSANAAFGSEFDVRRIVLLSYRDNVILPRHDSLKATFSRLSLESINPSVSLVSESPDPARPSTAASLDPGLSSFNSQGSTLIGDGNRSRATSNLSAPELPPFASPPFSRRHPSSQQEQLDTSSTQVTETVGRMLQCVSVLASVQSRDDSQIKMEALAKELKLNWLGRGRTGRNRRGFVGTRVRTDVHQREGDGRRMEPPVDNNTNDNDNSNSTLSHPPSDLKDSQINLSTNQPTNQPNPTKPTLSSNQQPNQTNNNKDSKRQGEKMPDPPQQNGNTPPKPPPVKPPYGPPPFPPPDRPPPPVPGPPPQKEKGKGKGK
ncbi:MAG: hypothetical protein L6R42_006622, partial [Xanthoria sp. 1 TBL-2021]